MSIPTKEEIEVCELLSDALNKFSLITENELIVKSFSDNIAILHNAVLSLSGYRSLAEMRLRDEMAKINIDYSESE